MNGGFPWRYIANLEVSIPPIVKSPPANSVGARKGDMQVGNGRCIFRYYKTQSSYTLAVALATETPSQRVVLFRPRGRFRACTNTHRPPGWPDLGGQGILAALQRCQGLSMFMTASDRSYI
jgi:hypothetical protein